MRAVPRRSATWPIYCYFLHRALAPRPALPINPKPMARYTLEMLEAQTVLPLADLLGEKTIYEIAPRKNLEIQWESPTCAQVIEMATLHCYGTLTPQEGAEMVFGQHQDPLSENHELMIKVRQVCHLKGTDSLGTKNFYSNMIRQIMWDFFRLSSARSAAVDPDLTVEGCRVVVSPPTWNKELEYLSIMRYGTPSPEEGATEVSMTNAEGAFVFLDVDPLSENHPERVRLRAARAVSTLERPAMDPGSDYEPFNWQLERTPAHVVREINSFFIGRCERIALAA